MNLNYNWEQGQRRLDHYNKWLLDNNRPFGERYPGFPEDLAREKAVEALKKEVAAKKEVKVKKPVVAKPKKVKQIEPGTKLEKAIAIFRRIGDNKAQVIETIQQECGMTPLGAQTYYYNARKYVASQGN